MDRLHAQGIAAVGSHQLVELMAEFGLQHDEYEARRRADDHSTSETTRANRPAWKRSPRR